MKLLSLSLKGFGPYTDVNVIDFPRARKVALLGTNGAGKTFLLDAIPAVLFKSVPNRKGGFYEQFSGNDAFIDLTFEFNGSTIKARRMVNANSRTQKAFLYKDGEPLNDGKDAAFSDEIRKLGINETAFLAAVYQTQNGAGNVLNMDVDSRIKLLSIILDLMKFDTDHAKVVEAHKEISRTVEGLQIRRSEIQRQIPEADSLKEQQAVRHAEIDSHNEALAQIAKCFEEAVQTVANAKANAQGVDDLKREAENLLQEVITYEKETDDLGERIQNNRTLVIDRKDEILKAVLTTEVNRKHIGEKQAEIQELQRFAQQAQASLEQWNTDRRSETASINEKLTGERSKLLALDGQLRDAMMAKAKIQTAKSTAEGRIDTLKPSNELIDRVPCASLPQMNSSCELLKNAHASSKLIGELLLEVNQWNIALQDSGVKISELETKVEDQQNDISALEDDLKQIMSQQPPAEFADALADFNKRIQEANQGINAANQHINEAADLAKLSGKLEGAEEKVADYEARLAVLFPKIKATEEALSLKREKIREASDLEATVQAAEKRKADLQVERQLIAGKLHLTQEALGHLNAKLEEASRLTKEAEALTSEITEQQATLAEVQILRDGLGPKGAKNVKIDAAGKAITERANRLIRIGLGPQFSIVINTLRELQSKDENGDPEVRETLELRIINNDSGEEMLIENLSGGEKAMAGLVFSLSLAVEQREASGLDIRTLILDEPSAGLSEENSIKYLTMLDAVLDETGLEQVFFISHMPSMQNLADASLFVTKGSNGESSKVEVIR